MPNGFSNEFDLDQFNSMMDGSLKNTNPNLQGYISSILDQSVVSFLSSAFSYVPPDKSKNTPAAASGAPNMESLVMQMMQMLLFPPGSQGKP